MKTSPLRSLCGLGASFMSIISGCATSPEPSSEPVVVEELAADAGGMIESVVYSRDFSRFAIAAEIDQGGGRNNSLRVLRDGTNSEPFLRLLTPLRLSPDGGTLIYTALEVGGSQSIYVNGAKNTIPSGHFPPESIVFSDDGTRYAWYQQGRTTSEGQGNEPCFKDVAIVTIDGAAESFPLASFVTFVTGANGRPEPVFTSWDEDGTTWLHRGAELTQAGTGYSDGLAGRVYASSDGTRTAYFLADQGSDESTFFLRLYIDGVASGTYTACTLREMASEEELFLFWNRDGTHYAFNAYQDGMGILVRDGEERAYDTIEPWVWSRLTPLPAFALDGRLLHAEVGPDRTTSLFIDGVAQARFESGIRVETLKFSDDGRHYSAVIYNTHDSTCAMWIDGVTGPFYYDVGMLAGSYAPPPCFSPEGRHVAYPAIHKDGHWLIVVDGREIHFPDTIRKDNEYVDALWFISENVLGYYRVEGTKLFRGKVILPE